MPQPGSNKSLMRSLGEFVGHITRAVKADVSQPTAHPAANPGPPSPAAPTADPVSTAPTGTRSRRQTQQQTIHTEDGTMILRRTIIEEVQIQPVPQTPPKPPMHR